MKSTVLALSVLALQVSVTAMACDDNVVAANVEVQVGKILGKTSVQSLLKMDVPPGKTSHLPDYVVTFTADKGDWIGVYNVDETTCAVKPLYIGRASKVTR